MGELQNRTLVCCIYHYAPGVCLTSDACKPLLMEKYTNASSAIECAQLRVFEQRWQRKSLESAVGTLFAFS